MVVVVVVRLGLGLSEDNLSAGDKDRFWGFQALGFSSNLFFSFIFSYFMVRRGDE